MAEGMSASRPRCDWEDLCSCREGMVHCTDRSWFTVRRSDGDPTYPAEAEACARHLGDEILGMLDGDDTIRAVVDVRWAVTDEDMVPLTPGWECDCGELRDPEKASDRPATTPDTSPEKDRRCTVRLWTPPRRQPCAPAATVPLTGAAACPVRCASPASPTPRSCTSPSRQTPRRAPAARRRLAARITAAAPTSRALAAGASSRPAAAPDSPRLHPAHAESTAVLPS